MLLLNRQNDWLVPRLRQFFLLPNIINKFMDHLHVRINCKLGWTQLSGGKHLDGRIMYMWTRDREIRRESRIFSVIGQIWIALMNQNSRLPHIWMSHWRSWKRECKWRCGTQNLQRNDHLSVSRCTCDCNFISTQNRSAAFLATSFSIALTFCCAFPMPNFIPSWRRN